jgi:hypothetical protein
MPPYSESLDHALHIHLHHPPPPVVCLACAVEASIEVIDDLQGEAQEIAQAGNTFITYGPPMQLARVHPPPLQKTFRHHFHTTTCTCA